MQNCPFGQVTRHFFSANFTLSDWYVVSSSKEERRSGMRQIIPFLTVSALLLVSRTVTASYTKTVTSDGFTQARIYLAKAAAAVAAMLWRWCTGVS